MRINYFFFPTLLIAFALFGFGRYLARLKLAKGGNAALVLLAFLAAIPGLAFVFYYFHLFDNAEWFYNFRAMRMTELLAAGMGLSAGMLHEWSGPDTSSQKPIVPAVLFLLVFIPYLKPVLSPVDLSRLQSDCSGDVCLQSTESTCGPASAANILKKYGFSASERQLAYDSFTSTTGTENWYLARSLRQRGFDVRAVIHYYKEEPLPSPSVAGVTLKGGAGHFIAILSADHDDVTAVDPLVGMMSLPRARLLERYHFTGFYLIIRPKNQPH